MFESQFLTARELADMLKISTAAVRKWSGQGCPSVRLGSRLVRFQLPAVIDWLQTRSRQTKGGE